MRGYDWSYVANKLGYKTETEMWNGLYWDRGLKPCEIIPIVSEHIEGVYAICSQSVHTRMIRCGVKRRSRGGANGRVILWHGQWEQMKKLDYEHMTAREICDTTGMESFQFYNLRRKVSFTHLRAR